MLVNKRDIILQLQCDILQWQGFKPPSPGSKNIGLGRIEQAFPHQTFPTGVLHEFISPRPVDAAATSGFTAALIAPLMEGGGACVWISTARKIYPPGLKAFGIKPDRVIFMDMASEKEALWATEEALKCEGLAAVVGEVRDINLTVSRRFQLAVERSRVTGLLLRHSPRNLHPIAAVARWQITHLPSELETLMPGLGFPRWNVEITRIRNGQPGIWEVEWRAGQFLVRPAQRGSAAAHAVDVAAGIPRRQTG